MNRRTRAQEDMILAERLVSQVEKEEDEIRKIYGGLCHSFPVLIRTCGLCQAIAFHKAKAAATGTPRGKAHHFLLLHVGACIGGGKDILSQVRDADAMTYMLYTRQILGTWIYFKRFAVSILKVESNDSGRETEADNAS